MKWLSPSTTPAMLKSSVSLFRRRARGFVCRRAASIIIGVGIRFSTGSTSFANSFMLASDSLCGMPP